MLSRVITFVSETKYDENWICNLNHMWRDEKWLKHCTSSNRFSSRFGDYSIFNQLVVKFHTLQGWGTFDVKKLLEIKISATTSFLEDYIFFKINFKLNYFLKHKMHLSKSWPSLPFEQHSHDLNWRIKLEGLNVNLWLKLKLKVHITTASIIKQLQ